ncbi:UNVERIFIED_CONTAM: hypothetical protein Cloal_0164 [Acetivibrio alkalicellulosi]
MKKMLIICLFIFSVSLFFNTSTSVGWSSFDKIDIEVNSNMIFINNRPERVDVYIEEDIIYLPIVDIISLLGGTVEFKMENKCYYIILKGREVSIWIGKRVYLINDDVKEVIYPLLEINGTHYISIRHLAQILNYQIYWDNVLRKATLSNSRNLNNEYIFKDSKSKVLSDLEVAQKDLETLQLSKREIYARHGYIFEDEKEKNYFLNKSWYTVKSNDSIVLSEIEKQNLDLINYYIDIKERKIDIIIIDKDSFKLILLLRGDFKVSYTIAIGKSSTPTPVGEYKIINKYMNPGGPFGTRWMGLSRRNYGIHGNNDPDSIGTMASLGCVRLHNEDVNQLYDKVYIGIDVIIK